MARYARQIAGCLLANLLTRTPAASPPGRLGNPQTPGCPPGRCPLPQRPGLKVQYACSGRCLRELKRAIRMPDITPAKWLSHETASEVGSTPRIIPPKAIMQTLARATVPRLRLKI